jgi:hypothetical protein
MKQMETLNERYLDGVYEEFSREHVKLLQNMKSSSGDSKAIEKQIIMISTLLVQILKLRNYRKMILERKD